MGPLSPYTCPECHGVLTIFREGSLIRFRCRTDHAYSADTLLATVTETIEDKLYSTLRSMDKAIILLNHLGDHHAEANQPKRQKAQEAQGQSDQIRQMAENHQTLSPDRLLQQAEGITDSFSQ